jgi:AraC-like DNA-binding protein
MDGSCLILRELPEGERHRWRERNCVLVARTRRGHVPPLATNLSIRCTFRGWEHHRIGERRIAVGTRHFLVLNHDRIVETDINCRFEVLSVSIFFRPELVSERAAVRHLAFAAALSSGTFLPRASVEVAERLYPHDASLRRLLRYLLAHVDMGIDDGAWYDEHVALVLDRLLDVVDPAPSYEARMHDALPEVREEIRRRVERARQFVHQCPSAASPSRLAAVAELPEPFFRAAFEHQFRTPAVRYLDAVRMQRAEQRVRESRLSIDELAAELATTPACLLKKLVRHSSLSTEELRELRARAACGL